MGGMIARVVAFVRTVVDGAQAPEVRVDDGSGAASTPYHFAPPGDDSQPLAGDVVHVASAVGAGFGSAVGYQDPDTEPKAGAGERRLYARSGPGEVACEIWLKADGSIELTSGDTAVIVDADGMRLGSPGASEFVALAQLVADQLTALKDAITNSPVVALDGGASFKAGIVAALATWPESVAAEKVRAE